MQVAILLYEGYTALDWIGPHDVLNVLPEVEPVTVAERPGPVANDSGTLEIVASHSLDEAPRPDIVVVPGGLRTHEVLDREPLLDWLRSAHETSTWTTSVCTGSLLLAAAGLLDGVEASTHWMARERLAALGAIPVGDRVIERGKIITAAGVSSGIDMALRLVQKLHGDEASQAVQLAIEYDPEPPFDAGSPEKAGEPIVAAVRAGMDAVNTTG